MARYTVRVDANQARGEEIRAIGQEAAAQLRAQASITGADAWHQTLHRAIESYGCTGEAVKALTGLTDTKSRAYKSAQRAVQLWEKGRMPKASTLEGWKARLDLAGGDTSGIDRLLSQLPANKAEREAAALPPGGDLNVRFSGEIAVGYGDDEGGDGGEQRLGRLGRARPCGQPAHRRR